MSNFTEFKSYTWNFQNFNCVITIIVKFDIHFLGLPWEFYFGVTTDNILHLKPLKNVKKNAIFFKLFFYKIFVHWKSKLLNPPSQENPSRPWEKLVLSASPLSERLKIALKMSASQSPYRSTSFDKIFAAKKQVYLINFINFCFFILLDGNTRATFDGLSSEENYKFNSIKQHT